MDQDGRAAQIGELFCVPVSCLRAGSRSHAGAKSRSRNDHNHLHGGLSVYEGGWISSNHTYGLRFAFSGGFGEIDTMPLGSMMLAKWLTRQFRDVFIPWIELSGSSDLKKTFADSSDPFHRSLAPPAGYPSHILPVS